MSTLSKRRTAAEKPLGRIVESSSHRFGWCTTGQHDGCSARTQWYERVYICSCDCHTQEKKAKK